MTDALNPRRFGTIHTATDGRDILLNDPDGWEADAPWLWWNGPADSEDGTGGPWGNPPPGAEWGAPTMRGTSLPAVTRCVALLTESIAGMPWKTYRGREQVQAPAWITDPQAASRDGRLRSRGVVETDVRFSAVEFWAQYITSYLNWGEGIAYTPRELVNGEPTGPIVTPIYILNPNRVEVEDGRYYVEDDESDDGRFYIDSRELLITRNIVRPGKYRGIGAIQAHAYDFALSADIRAYLDTLFQRGIPNGYLKTSKPDITQEQVNTLRDRWMAQHGKIRKSIAVLNATTEFHPLEIDPQAVQITELMRLTAWQVCIIYGVPPGKLGISLGQSNTYSNLEAEGTAFVRDSLLPIARKLEAAIDAVLPAGTQLKIDFNQLQRADTASRFDAYKVGIDAGFLTVDEVRAYEDLPPIAPAGAPVDDAGSGTGAVDSETDPTPVALVDDETEQ